MAAGGGDFGARGRRYRALVDERPGGAHVPPRALTLAFLAAISAVAILLTDIGIVVGLSGALLGASIVYIFPALIYTQVAAPSPAVYALVPLGAFLGLLGVWQTLK